MATSNNPLLLALSGSLGDLITIKNYSGKIVVCHKIGARKKKTSKAQAANEQLFRYANEYAKKLYDDPVAREEARLRLKVPHGNALYRAILKECREELKKKQ
jgi:hypothetical protein